MPSIREMLEAGNNIVAVGAHDGLTARLGQQAGFDAIWGSGFEVSASFGLPDTNVVTMTEHLNRCAEMAAATTLPVIADCDNGYGDVGNAVRTIAEFERRGIAGVCLEDNPFPKRSSLYDIASRVLTKVDEHASKIEACARARRGDLFLIARTEAFVAGLGLAACLERAHSYADAGADAILVHSRARDGAEVFELARAWRRKVPLVAVPTTYDCVTAGDLHAVGYRIVIFANQGLRAAVRAVRENLRTLRTSGCASSVNSNIATLEEIFSLVGVDANGRSTDATRK